MKQVDDIIYDAISEDSDLMEAIGGRVVSTCFEIPPEQEDNTPIPNIVIIDEGFQNNESTKDTLWEGTEDQVQVTVSVAADSPGDVKDLVRKVRSVVENYIATLYAQGNDTPQLQSLTSDGISYDPWKPCYFQNLYYTCIINCDLDDEQEGNQ